MMSRPLIGCSEFFSQSVSAAARVSVRPAQTRTRIQIRPGPGSGPGSRSDQDQDQDQDPDQIRTRTRMNSDLRNMKLFVVVVLYRVLSVSADSLHDDLAIVGCSASDGEAMYAANEEELWFADFINKKGVDAQPSFVQHVDVPGAYEQAVANQQVCRQNLKVYQERNKDVPLERDPPSSPVVYPKDDLVQGEENVLVCYVTGFYPAPVTFSWTKNGKNVTEGTSVNVPYPNKDGSFHQTSRLDLVPQQGDVYSCSVKHLSLQEPLTRLWDVDLKQASVGPDVFCGLGLTLGLLGVAAGTFFLIKGNECS